VDDVPTRRSLTIAFLGLLAVLASVLAAAGPARAQEEEQVVPIAPAPPAPEAPQVPTLEPPPDLRDLAGKPITRVAVVLEGNVWDDVEVPALRSVRPGEALTAAAARRALDEALATGHFARGRVTAAAENGGALLVVRVVPRKLVGRLEVDLHGARLDRDELLRAADLADGGELVGADVDDVAARVRRFFALHGYPEAIVDLQTRSTEDPTRTLVVVDVHPGAPRTIDRRHFYVFGAGFSEVQPLTSVYEVHPGDRADEPAIDSADGALQHALHGHGWFHAKVTHDLVWVRGDERGARHARVVLRVRVDTGARQEPRFEGNDHYDAVALTAALGLDEETDRSPSHLSEKLVAFYQKRGFLDVEVRPEVRGSDRDPVQLLVFHVDEHRRVSVVARHYPCLKLDAIKNLSGGGPRSPADIGTQIDSYLEEELPGADLLVDPDPQSVSATVGAGVDGMATGARPVPLDLHPDATYVADTYERAVEHVQELYRNEGFLHAQVGPVQIVRAQCSPRSPPGRCVPLPQPPLGTLACTYDATGLPLPAQPLGSAHTCRPDPAQGIECAPTMQLLVPVKLGPRTTLWDVGFTGVKSMSEQDVLAAAELPLGEPVSTAKLDDARRRIVDWYKEAGYAYVDVKYTLEPSLDWTRARVRFDVNEGDQVIVRGIVIRGLETTRESVVRRRIALQIGQPYRTSDVRKTQERIATLGVFSSIQVGLSDPYVPQPNKVVIVDVVERLPRYVEVTPGFSTGEGVRGTLEYDERNAFGDAVGLTFRAQLSYLPDFLILDPQVATNYQQIQDRLARRITLTAGLPDLGFLGLGPVWRGQVDLIYVRDLERDYTLDKTAAFLSLNYRPSREVQIAVGPSIENNDVRLFQFNSIAAYLACQANSGVNITGLATALRVPDGASLVNAQRVSIAWDRRDSAFNAKRGTYVYLGAELVNSTPEGAPVAPDVSNLAQCAIDTTNPDVQKALAPAPQTFSHFVRLTQTFAGYIPITSKITLALELRLGENVRMSDCTSTDPSNPAPPFCSYPDRLFFMGGFDSMRGWLQDTFIPQDYADQIAKNPNLCVSSDTNCVIPLRGGNLMINPRAELRFPIRGPIDGAIFADVGNLWFDPTYIFDHALVFRADVGPGVRVQTPVGPLVFDYGINVTRRPYEDFGAFHFAIGLF